MKPIEGILAIVLDEEKNLYLPLRKSSIYTLDRYMIEHFSSSEDVRKVYKKKIRAYLEANKEYLMTHPKKPQGDICVLYEERSGQMTRLKAFYQGDEDKLDQNKVWKGIINRLRASRRLLGIVTKQYYFTMSPKQEYVFERASVQEACFTESEIEYRLFHGKPIWSFSMVEEQFLHWRDRINYFSFDKRYSVLRLMDKTTESFIHEVHPKWERALLTGVTKASYQNQTISPVRLKLESGQLSLYDLSSLPVAQLVEGLPIETIRQHQLENRPWKKALKKLATYDRNLPFEPVDMDEYWQLVEDFNPVSKASQEYCLAKRKQ